MNSIAVEALSRLYPGRSFTIIDDNPRTAVFYDTQPRPTEEALVAMMAIITAEREAVAYRELRASAYPPIGEQLDALFKAGAFPKSMADKIQAVKDRFPKPGA